MVTGGAGFLGRHVVEKLQRRGADVFIPRSAVYDLREKDRIVAALADGRPEIVVHLAAVVGGIGANRANPGRFFYDDRADGAMPACGRREVRRDGDGVRIPQVRAVAVPRGRHLERLPGGDERAVRAREEDAAGASAGISPAVRVGFNAITLFPVNLYGPGDNFDPESIHVIPALIRKFVEATARGADTVDAWGTGSASREFLYLEDAAEAIALATERYDAPDPVNLGAGREITIRELAQTIAELCGFGGRIAWDASQPDGQPRRMLDTSRAREAFGFSAQTDFEEGLRRTISWYAGTLGGRRAAPRARPELSADGGETRDHTEGAERRAA